MVEAVLRQSDPSTPIALIHAHRSKAARAEPIVMAFRRTPPAAALLNHLPDLEEELLSWTPDSRWSPNRLDALVHAARAVLIDDKPLRRFGGLEPRTRTLSRRIGAALSPHRAERDRNDGSPATGPSSNQPPSLRNLDPNVTPL